MFREHTLVYLPRIAIGLVVENRGVVVEELFAAREVEPVEQGLDPGRIESRLQIVPAEPATHRKGERAIVRIALLVHAGESDVRGRSTFALHPDVLEPRIARETDLRSGVCEIRVPAEGDKALHHGRLRIGAEHDERARSEECLGRRTRGDVQHLDWHIEHHVCRDMQEHAVRKQGGTECREWRGLWHRDVAEMRLHDRIGCGDGAGERTQFRAACEARNPRKRGIHVPVHHHQKRPIGPAHEPWSKVCCRHNGRGGRRTERRGREGLKWREPPLLVARRGNTDGGKALGALPAQ